MEAHAGDACPIEACVFSRWPTNAAGRAAPPYNAIRFQKYENETLHELRCLPTLHT
jgi:hypothetical protein